MPMIKYVYAVLTVIALSVGVYAPFYYFLSQQKNEKLDLHFTDKINHASIQFNAVNSAYALLANIVFDNIINKPEIVSLVKQANGASAEEQALLRQELYNKLLPLYKNLDKYNVRQLHFHLKNSISFLRFHRPEKYGDSLEVVRYSIDKVNRTGRPSFGFEEGRIFNGFRNVFPLFLDKKFGGTVELSYSFNAIKTEGLKLRSAYYSFIIRKDIVSNKVWKSEISHYVPSSISPAYLQEKSTMTDETQGNLTKDLIEQINTNISQEADKGLLTEGKFILHTKINNATYIAMFVPIYNVENKQVAYYVSYEKDPTVSLIEKTFIVETLMALIGALVFSLMLVLYLMSKRRAARALELLATTDPLTKIANRNKLNIILEKSIHLALRYKLPLSVIFFDIDHFKQINDAQGHDAGDTVLTTISTLISNQIRSSDLLARWGGEEFIIILPETEHHDAKKLAEKFRRLIQDYKFLPNVDVTCSFGITQLRADDNEASLLKRVDDALYSAKKNGRNKVIEIS